MNLVVGCFAAKRLPQLKALQQYLGGRLLRIAATNTFKTHFDETL